MREAADAERAAARAAAEEEAARAAEDEAAHAAEAEAAARREGPTLPNTTEEAMHAAAKENFCVSDDKSSARASPAMKAYNAEATDAKVTHKRGTELPEPFTIIEVRASPRIMSS